MDFKEKEMNLELKEQDSEHNKKKKEEGSPKRKKGCFKRVLSVLVLVVIIGFSFFAGRQSVMTSNAYGTGLNNGKILRKLSMLEAFAGNYYLNKIDAENVENNIYKGFAKGLQDPYAEYYTPSEYQQLSKEDAGKYNGIGISIAKDTDTNYPEVVSVFKDQPAYKAGLKTGDLIIAVNKKSTMNMELQEVVSEIKKKDIGTYSTSCFLDIRDALQVMKFAMKNPPNGKICKGTITKTSGYSQKTSEREQESNTSHVDWWIFNDINIENEILSNFSIVKGDEEDAQ